MKAIDYAIEFLKDSFEGMKKGHTVEAAEKMAALRVIGLLIEEIDEIAKTRLVGCDGAMSAIFKEQNRKWEAIIRRLPDLAITLRPDAFWNVLVTRFEVSVNGHTT